MHASTGELPVCYVALRPVASVTEDELRDHAQQAIAERPAWPKQIIVIDANPVTTVGKIYKPQLRCDIAARLVTGVVRDQLRVAGAQVQAQEGGRRGMRVNVTLPAAGQVSVVAVEQALAAYLFEAVVTVA